MGKRKKKLNTGLIAFITTMGIIVVVSVVGLVMYHSTRRDPAVLARNAADREAAGDLRRAAEFYYQAYVASREEEPEYLLESARCWFDVGELGAWREGLRLTLARDTHNEIVLQALLEGLWRLQFISGGDLGAGWEQIRRDYARDYLEIDPEDPLALASRARALWALGDEDLQDEADAAMQKALEVAPNDPRVALTRLIAQSREVREEIGKARARGASRAQINAIQEEAYRQRPELLKPVLEAHPGHAELAIFYARSLQDVGRRLMSAAPDAPEGRAHFVRAVESLQRALELTPDHPDLLLALAEAQRLVLVTQYDELSPEEQASRIDEIVSLADRAVEREPGLYAAYTLGARIELARPREEGVPTREAQAKRYERALDRFEDAAQSTMVLFQDNVRARVRDQERLRMLQSAFNAALSYARWNIDEEREPEIQARAQVFLEDAETKYPEQPTTYYMRGEFAALQGDRTEAMQAFIKADEKVTSLGGGADFWFIVAGVDELPSEQLARLYKEAGQLGEADRYARRAVAEYESSTRRVPAPSLILERARIARGLGEYEEALDLLDKYRREFPDDPRFESDRQVVLRLMGRDTGAEAEDFAAGSSVLDLASRAEVALAGREYAMAREILERLAEHSDAGPTQREFARERIRDTRLWEAAVRAREGEYAAGAELVDNVLRDAEATESQLFRALRLYVSIMSRDDRREEARETLRGLRSGWAAAVARQAETYEVLLAEPDREKRRERLLEMIARNPDAYARADEYYTFYLNEDAEKAAEYLAEMVALRPDDMSLVHRLFHLRLNLRQFDEAGELLVTLSEYEDGRGYDHVGGATYRGRMAMARGDAETAVSEFKTALRDLPSSAALEVDLGQAYLMGGQTERGIEALERALDMDPRNFAALRLLTLACEEQAGLASGARRTELESRALEYLERAEQINPNQEDIRAARQRALARSKPLQAVAESFERWKAAPDKLENVRQLSRLFADLSNTVHSLPPSEKERFVTQGNEFYTAAPEQLDDADAVTSLALDAAQYYGATGQVDAGEDVLRELVRSSSGRQKVTVQLRLGQYFETIEAPDAAERAYRQAQAMVNQLNLSAEERAELQRAVGLTFIDFYRAQRRPGEIINVCRWLLDQLDGTDVDVEPFRVSLMDALLNSGQLDQAEREITAFLADYGEDNLAGQVARAMLYLNKNQRRDAEEALTTILELSPGHVSARLMRGGLYLQRGAYDEARQDLLEAKRLVRDSQTELRIRQQLAQLYERTGQLTLAERELRDMLELLDQRAGTAADRQRVVTRLVRLLYSEAQRFRQAQRLISEYMERYPNEAAWPYELGQLFVSRAQNALREARQAEQEGKAAEARELQTEARESYVSAASYFDRAARTAGQANPAGFESSLIAQMSALIEADRPNEALDLYENLPLSATPGLRMQAALAHTALGNPDAARAEWQQALGRAVQVSSALAGPMMHRVRESMSAEEAETMLRTLLEDVPPGSASGIRLQLILGEHLLRTGDPAGALPRLNEVTSRVAAGTSEYREALMLRAEALRATEGATAAIDTYREIVRHYPDDVPALNNLAYFLVVAEGDAYRPKEAREYADRLWQLVGGQPRAGTMLDTVGWVYYHNDELELAAGALAEAVASDEDETGNIHYHLGKVYAELNRVADARRVLERGLELAREASTDDADEVVSRINEELEGLQ